MGANKTDFPKKIDIYIATVLLSFCSIVYELLLAQSLTVIFGGNVIRYSVTIGLYLFGLGLGAEVSKFLQKRPAHLFILLELLLSVIGLLSVAGLFLLSQYQFIYENLVFYAGHAIILLIGFLSGAEVPLLMTLARQKQFYRILSLDYYGALIGSVLFGVYFYSNWGLIATSIFVASLNLFIALYFLIRGRKEMPVFLFILGVPLVLLFITASLYHKKIEDYVYKAYIGHFATYQLMDYGQLPEHIREETIKPYVKVIEQFFTPYQWVAYLSTKPHKDHPTYPYITEDKHAILLDNVKQMLHGEWDQKYVDTVTMMGLSFVRGDNLKIAVAGDGDTQHVERLLQYERVAHVDHIDIDKDFKQYMLNHPLYGQHINLAHHDERLDNHYEDAFKFFRKNMATGEKYDVVHLAFSHLRNFKTLHLFSEEFFTTVKYSLKPGGVFVTWVYTVEDFFTPYLATVKKAGFNYFTMVREYDYEKNQPGRSVLTFSDDPLRAERFSEMNAYQDKIFNNIHDPTKVPHTETAKPNSIFLPNYDMVFDYYKNHTTHPFFVNDD